MLAAQGSFPKGREFSPHATKEILAQVKGEEGLNGGLLSTSYVNTSVNNSLTATALMEF